MPSADDVRSRDTCLSPGGGLAKSKSKTGKGSESCRQLNRKAAVSILKAFFLP